MWICRQSLGLAYGRYVSDTTLQLSFLIKNPFYSRVYTLSPGHNGCHFPDVIFKCIFLYEIVWIQIISSLKFVSKGPINNIPALVQIMAWCRPGDKSLSEPIIVSLSTHIFVTRSMSEAKHIDYLQLDLLWLWFVFSTGAVTLPFWWELWRSHVIHLTSSFNDSSLVQTSTRNSSSGSPGYIRHPNTTHNPW